MTMLELEIESADDGPAFRMVMQRPSSEKVRAIILAIVEREQRPTDRVDLYHLYYGKVQLDPEKTLGEQIPESEAATEIFLVLFRLQYEPSSELDPLEEPEGPSREAPAGLTKADPNEGTPFETSDDEMCASPTGPIIDDETAETVTTWHEAGGLADDVEPESFDLMEEDSAPMFSPDPRGHSPRRPPRREGVLYGGVVPSGRGSEPRSVGRHATVRYYNQMNPLRVYPLRVMLSDDTVLDVSKPNVEQRRSRRFQVEVGSKVTIEPVLPGCHCYPARKTVKVQEGDIEATFWVVPSVLGRVMEPRIELTQEGEILAEIPLDIRVKKQAAALLMGVAGLLLPFVLAILKYFRLDFESQLQDGFSLYEQLLSFALSSISAEALGAGLLFGAAGLFLLSRPRQRDVFWELNTIGPQAQLDSAIQAFQKGDQVRAVGLINSLLETHPEFLPVWEFCGEWHYNLARQSGVSDTTGMRSTICRRPSNWMVRA